MSKRLPLLCLLLLSLLMTGCTAHDPLLPMASMQEEAHIPAPHTAAPAQTARQETVTLWFRFGEEPLLAPEAREIDLSPTASYELTLLQALVSGPSANSPELTGLFPPGTQVLATTRQDRLLFVTLSHQIMNAYADEPDSWSAQSDWAAEAPLRRKLAMQAIAATVTENCDVDTVVILVDQQKQVTNSLRLRESYYLTGAADGALAAPLTRDESCLLTHRSTMEIILKCWAERDWPRLYAYVARTDPANGQERPDSEAFATLMNELPHLTEYAVSEGSIDHSGTQATFTLQATLMQEGNGQTLDSAIVRLCRERGIWRIGLSQLTQREVSE